MCVLSVVTWKKDLRRTRIAALVFALVAASPLGIVRAEDADTLKVDGKTYRLDGIDAPEIDQNCLDGEGALYPCGRGALEELKKLIAGRSIQCTDLGADSAYPKRRIGQCSAGGTDLNHWLVQQGWALNFEPYAKRRFKIDEDDARVGHFGLWKGCFVAPQDFRRWNKRKATLLGANCPEDARAKLFPDDPAMPPGCEIKGKYGLRAWPTKASTMSPAVAASEPATLDRRHRLAGRNRILRR